MQHINISLNLFIASEVVHYVQSREMLATIIIHIPGYKTLISSNLKNPERNYQAGKYSNAQKATKAIAHTIIMSVILLLIQDEFNTLTLQ